jgi:acyl-CoA thioesterase FadM
MTSTSLIIPDGAFTDRLRVRSYEVGQSGTVGLGTALRYCEALATDASASVGFDRSWYEAHHAAWVVREMTILLGVLPRIGEELGLATWVGSFRRVQAQREYAIWQTSTGRMVARASARWAYCDADRGQLIRIPDTILETMQSPGSSMSDYRHRQFPGGEARTGTSSTIFLQAREYETDTQQHVNNCVYADWLAEAYSQAARAADTCRPVDSRPRFYRIEYIRAVVAGDALRIETETAPRGVRGIQARHSIIHVESNTAVVQAYAEHIHLSSGFTSAASPV